MNFNIVFRAYKYRLKKHIGSVPLLIEQNFICRCALNIKNGYLVIGIFGIADYQINSKFLIELIKNQIHAVCTVN